MRIIEKFGENPSALFRKLWETNHNFPKVYSCKLVVFMTYH